MKPTTSEFSTDDFSTLTLLGEAMQDSDKLLADKLATQEAKQEQAKAQTGFNFAN